MYIGKEICSKDPFFIFPQRTHTNAHMHTSRANADTAQEWRGGIDNQVKTQRLENTF